MAVREQLRIKRIRRITTWSEAGRIFDVPHNFVLSALYELPIFRHANGWVGRFLGG